MKQVNYTQLFLWKEDAKKLGYHVRYFESCDEYVATRSETDQHKMGVFMCKKISNEVYAKLQKNFRIEGPNIPHGWLMQ